MRRFNEDEKVLLGCRLVTDAAWYAGLRVLRTGVPAQRPQRVVYYPSSYEFGSLPLFLVDVSSVFETKQAAIRAYESQIFSGVPGGPDTFLSSRRFLEGIEARARMYGRMANVDYAEGFVSSAPPTLADPVAAFEGYEADRRDAVALDESPQTSVKLFGGPVVRTAHPTRRTATSGDPLPQQLCRSPWRGRRPAASRSASHA